MDDERKAALWKCKPGHVPSEQADGAMSGEVGRFLQESIRIAAQDDDGGAQIKFVVGPQQTRQQPSADETGTASQENGLSAQGAPQPARL